MLSAFEDLGITTLVYILYIYAIFIYSYNKIIGNGMCWVCDNRRFSGVLLEARKNIIEKL